MRSIEMDQWEQEVTETARQKGSVSAWRQRLARFAKSDQTVKAFCEQESVSTFSFYHWRRRLQQSAAESMSSPPPSFVDLGAVAAAGARTAANAPVEDANDFAIRLDLPGGIVLKITRR
jgi:transposase-like protein